MSAIFGVLRFDDAPTVRSALARMARRLTHRGASCELVHPTERVGLGVVTSLALEGVAVAERRDGADDSGLAVVADARLDNAAEVAGLLPQSPRRPAPQSAASLILSAYERWGIECPRRLLGDFALAVWDGRQQLLCCARDHFGVRPLYYLQLPRLVAFSTELTALSALDDFDATIDEARIGTFLLSNFEDRHETFYEHVRRLPPAHVLTVSDGRCQVAPYWQLDRPQELQLGSDREYAERFAAVFTEAVRCRMPTAARVGAHLSGGLDSSFVCAIARDHLRESTGERLQSFSVVYEEFPENDEREYVDAVLETGGFDPTFVVADGDIAPLSHIHAALERHGEPVYAPNVYLLAATCRAARERGVDVLLTGIDGDTVVSHGIDRLGELAADGRWESFESEANALSRHFDTANPAMLRRRYGTPKINTLLREGAFGRAGRQLFAMARAQGRPWSGALAGIDWRDAVRGLVPEVALSYARRYRRPALRPPFTPSSLNGFMRPEFAKRVGLTEQMSHSMTNGWFDAASERNGHHARLQSGLHGYVFEVMDRETAYFGVQASHPFFDRRLIELCLSMPSGQKLRGGWTRFVMRQAMEGHLPGRIQWRVGKGMFHNLLVHGMRTRDRHVLLGLTAHGLEPVQQYVDVDAFRKALFRFIEGEDGLELAIARVVALNTWLSRDAARMPG